MMHADNQEMRELSARICRDYLNGAWKNVNAQNIGFKHISGGLSNLLYHVSLPEELIKDDLKPDQKEPKEVLIRVYGQIHGERALEVLITESVIFTLLSERGLGPKLHGIFPGGRIEQYINARPLLTKELADPKLSTIIAQKMAAIHSMEVPLHKEPNWLWDTIERWIKSCERLFKNPLPEFARHLKQVDFRKEASWLKQILEAEKSPVVFCHNDMQEGNILICQDENYNRNSQPNIVLIDFEYCSYNYRAFDIANHFLEWTYDYTVKDFPFFKASPENYPSEEQKLLFIRKYLSELGSKENPNSLLREVKTLSLASHLFWGLWGCINLDNNKIPFGYCEYGVSRLQSYFELKKQFPQAIKRKLDVEEA